MIRGSCLCGKIKFEAEERPGKIFNCYCSICRKSHGAAFATQVFVKGETLRILKGEEFLKEYFSGRGYRAFCSNCGSRLMNYAKDKSLYLSVALSSIDSGFEGRPVADVKRRKGLDKFRAPIACQRHDAQKKNAETPNDP